VFRVVIKRETGHSEMAMRNDHAGSDVVPSNGMQSMRLRYGVNETDSWWHFALGPERKRIWQLHREMRIDIIRIFLFDKNAPDPLNEWGLFRSYVNAVLASGATPMVTFSKFRRPFGDHRAVRWFAEQCGEIVWHCLEEWGEDRVRDWHWCVWNEPNSDWIGGGVTFEQYRDIYECVAHSILRWLKPCLGTRRTPIGGPAVEGFQPFWKDWIWRFVAEVDADLIGFVNWHRYADWRDHGEKGAPANPATHEAVMLWHARDYEMRAQSVARLVRNPGVLNVCGEWNAHSHYLPCVRARFNQTLFGAAYGASALLHLIRGGADAEMLWTGTDDACGYGVLGPDASPTPLYFARRLCAQYLRYGDAIVMSTLENGATGLDGMVVRGSYGRSSAVLVHHEPSAATYDVCELTRGQLSDSRALIKIDCGTSNAVTTGYCHGTVTFDGYGVAVITNTVVGHDRSPDDEWI
jgi:hypothetical protein